MCSNTIQKKMFKQTSITLSKHFSDAQIKATVRDGFSRLELHSAFNFIKNKEHFSKPIDTVILESDLKVCQSASLFFTNKPLKITGKAKRKNVIVLRVSNK